MTRFAAEIVPNVNSISELTERASEFLRTEGVDDRAVHHVALVLDELLTNVGSHGGGSDAPASIKLEVDAEQVRGEIGDRGEPFDPRGAPDPDTNAPAEKRQEGGLGLFLIRRLTCALDYRSDGRQNWTTFCISRKTSERE